MHNTYYLASQMTVKSMKSMIVILGKAETWIKENNKTEKEFLDAKLAPDMFSFIKQVQIMSDNARGMVARFVGVDIPKMEDNEESFQDLVVRLNKTIEFVESFDEKSFDKADEQKIVLPYIQGKYQTASDYLIMHAVPNFYFHTVAAYSILRNLGIPLQKSDYIGGLNLHSL